MTSKKKPSKKRDPNEIDTRGHSHDDAATRIAGIVLRPTVQAASTIKEYGKTFGELDITSLVYSLGEQTKASSEGDATRAEAMMTEQAHTLDAIFNNLATKAISAEYMEQLDQYLKLGLRAQSQCRATWEALSTIKSPPVMGYIKQANIANGPQQVSNAATDGASRARENQNSQNKLMEKKDGERLDTGTKSTPGQADPAMATVGEVNRSKNRRR